MTTQANSTIGEIEVSLQKARAEIDAILKENHKKIIDGHDELQKLLSEVDKFTFNIVKVSKGRCRSKYTRNSYKYSRLIHRQSPL